MASNLKRSFLMSLFSNNKDPIHKPSVFKDEFGGPSISSYSYPHSTGSSYPPFMGGSMSSFYAKEQPYDVKALNECINLGGLEVEEIEIKERCDGCGAKYKHGIMECEYCGGDR